MSEHDPKHLAEPSQATLDSGEKLSEVLEVLKGSYREEGLVTLVKNIHTALHDKELGLIARVTRLEKAADRQNGWVMGVCFIGGLVGIIIGWCAELFSHKP